MQARNPAVTPESFTTLGSLLRYLRHRAQLTQRDLAIAVGYSEGQISRLEQNQRQVDRAIIMARFVPALELEHDRAWVERLLALVDGAAPNEAAPASAPAEPPPLAPVEAPRKTPPTNLPVPPTPFIGREREVAETIQLLCAPDTRLVTLSGPGGTGKTRLAVHVARAALDQFADGAFFVNLSPVNNPELVIAAIAHAIGLQESTTQQPLEQVQDALRRKHLLLVLDNFEQVVSSAPLLADLLAAASGLKLLVTSRYVLRLRGEKEFPVPPMALPQQHQVLPPNELLQYESVRLFVERARDVLPSFAETGESVRTIAEICIRLDGLPLAIELAAARVKVLQPAAMLTRLDQRLRFLTNGPRDLPSRQQTLRATLDWSYSLLTPMEQQIFRQLSVFSGGFTLETAEFVCAPACGSDVDILDSIESLIDKSLLRKSVAGEHEPRFIMLETIREYGLEQLHAAAEIEAAQERHARFFLDLAERAELQLKGAQQAQWLSRLEAEHNNIRTTLKWARDHGHYEVALRIVGTLWRFWWVRGYLTEGWDWAKSALDVIDTPTSENSTRIRAKALNAAGNIALGRCNYHGAAECYQAALPLWWNVMDQHGIAMALGNLGIISKELSDYATAHFYHEQSLAISRRLNDRLSVAYSLNNLGTVTSLQGDYKTARELFEESLLIRRELSDQGGVARLLGNLGSVAYYAGDIDRASSILEESLRLERQLEYKAGIADGLSDLGNVVEYQGDYQRARALHEESLAIRRSIDDSQGIAKSLSYLGRIALDEGDTTNAQVYITESFEIRRRLANKHELTEGLRAQAELMVAKGQAYEAIKLFSTAEALRETIGYALHTAARARYERFLAQAQAQLGPQQFEQAWAEGQTSTLDELVVYQRASGA